MGQRQHRCLLCGRARLGDDLECAGHHQLETIYLRGRGQGRGFQRYSLPADTITLRYFQRLLAAAEAQVAAALAALPDSMPAHVCPTCDGPLDWLPTKNWYCRACKANP